MSDWREEPWQEMEDEAWERMRVGDVDEAMRLARNAIRLNPDAIDSYVIIAQATDVPGEKIAFAREGVRIGQDIFAKELEVAPNDEFVFWSALETRPYMRALHTLSLALWDDIRPGAHVEAISIAQFALKICPNDNIGFRFLLAGWLADAGRWEEGYLLVQRSKDEIRTEMQMWGALYAFQAGDQSQAKAYAQRACTINPHIIAPLTRKNPPRVPPAQMVAWQSPEEAKAYAAEAHATWHAVPGAIDWLKKIDLN